jgi:hypothetical protein
MSSLVLDDKLQHGDHDCLLHRHFRLGLRNECGTVLDPGVLLLLCEERDRDHWCALAQRGAVYFTFSSDLVDLQVILERGACRCSVMVVGESEAFAAL